MKVESIAECSKRGIIGLEKQFLIFFLSGRLRQVLLYVDKELENPLTTLSFW